MKKFGILLAATAIAFAPIAVFAQAPTVPPPVSPPAGSGPVQSATDIGNLLGGILKWVSAIFWIVAIIFILYAAFLYLTAAGDESKVEKASHTLLYAVIAIVVALIAFALPSIVNSFLGLR